jgi:HAE1 family hydrophobic/amphiphilic exporter-1
MRVMDFTLNNFTMLGLVFAVGIVVDDAIVVIENIHRRMHDEHLDAMTAAIVGTREIALGVLATTLSLVVIFLPVAFMEGRIGRFFSSYGITVAFAVMVSLFVSFTLTPMMASLFLRPAKDEKARIKQARGGALMQWMTHHYDWVLQWSLKHRWIVMIVSFAVMASGIPLAGAVGFNYLPADDSGEFEVIFEAPEGSTLATALQYVEQIESRLKVMKVRGDQAILATYSTIGDTSGRLTRGDGPVTNASIYCRLPELGGFWDTLTGKTRRWTQMDAIAEARKIAAFFPDLRISVQRIQGLGGGGRNSELEASLTGPDLAKLTNYTERIMERMRAARGFVDADTTLSNRKPELRARIDRDKASQFGVPVREVATVLRAAVGGEVVSTFREEDEQYDVWLRAVPPDRSTQEAISQVRLATRNSSGGGVGTLIPLSHFVTFEEDLGPNQIERYQRQRRVSIVSNLSGISLSDAVREVTEMAEGLNMPAEYRIVFTGRARQLAETAESFFAAFLLALLFMYMILAAQFEHFVHPISILLSVPLSIPFALFTMWMLGEPLNIYGIFGVFMLFGVVKKNGILQVDYTNTLRRRGMPREEAILTANRARLRPILMTTVLLIVSMIPIALGTGPGAAGRASMAKVIVGGQLLCLLLSLLVTPVSYSLLDDLGAWITGSKRRKSRKSPVLDEP